jgi:hypothetical protein
VASPSSAGRGWREPPGGASFCRTSLCTLQAATGGCGLPARELGREEAPRSWRSFWVGGGGVRNLGCFYPACSRQWFFAGSCDPCHLAVQTNFRHLRGKLRAAWDSILAWKLKSPVSSRVPLTLPLMEALRIFAVVAANTGRCGPDWCRILGPEAPGRTLEDDSKLGADSVEKIFALRSHRGDHGPQRPKSSLHRETTDSRDTRQMICRLVGLAYRGHARGPESLRVFAHVISAPPGWPWTSWG